MTIECLSGAHVVERSSPGTRSRSVRHRLLHIAGRTTSRRLHLDRTWLWTTTLLNAIAQLRNAFASLTVTDPSAAHAAL
jgi:hypothetical protein